MAGTATMNLNETLWNVQEGINGVVDLAIAGTFTALQRAEAIEFATAILLAAGYTGSWPPKTTPTSREVTSYSKCASGGGKKTMPRGKGK